jgi:hypothetical protein
MVTWEFAVSVVTAHDRCDPRLPDVIRTQHGPGSLRNGRRPIRSHGAAVSALAIQLAPIIPLKAPAMQVQLQRTQWSLSRRLDMACSLGRCHPLDPTMRFRRGVVTWTTTQTGASAPG